MIQITELNEEIENIDKLECLLCEQLDQFLSDIWTEEGMTREPEEGDIFDGDPEKFRFYTPKAQKLIDEKFKELYAISKKYDPDRDNYDISSYMYQEG